VHPLAVNILLEWIQSLTQCCVTWRRSSSTLAGILNASQKLKSSETKFEHLPDFVIKIRLNFERGRRAVHCWPRARDDIITLTHKKEGRILVSELVGYILILLLDPRRSHGSSGSPRRARLDPRADGDVFIKAAAVQVQQPLFFSLSICALAAAAPPAAAAPAFKCALIYARAMPRVAHLGEKGARPFCARSGTQGSTSLIRAASVFFSSATVVIGMFFASHPGANALLAAEQGCRLACRLPNADQRCSDALLIVAAAALGGLWLLSALPLRDLPTKFTSSLEK